jgi:hypothetical protein
MYPLAQILGNFLNLFDHAHGGVRVHVHGHDRGSGHAYAQGHGHGFVGFDGSGALALGPYGMIGGAEAPPVPAG